jgi:hypothetical protein
MVPTMMMAPHRMFWRADAAMVARLPIPGAALWQAALVRARRGALLGVVIAAPVAALTTGRRSRHRPRFAALVGALALCAAALVPAVCVGAAHAVASGQADAASRALAGDYTVADHVAARRAAGRHRRRRCARHRDDRRVAARRRDPRGPAILIGVVAVAALAAALAGATAARVLPRAMREVAALDRQILAHLEIQPITGLERAVAARLRDGAGPVFDRMARLLRRRYPLFALAGAAGAVALVGLGLGRPSGVEPWLAVVAGALAAVAATLAHATGRPPIELPRATALLPIAPTAMATARRALSGCGWAVWLAPAVVDRDRGEPDAGRERRSPRLGRRGRRARRRPAPPCGVSGAAAQRALHARRRAASARRRRRRDRPAGDRTGRSPRCGDRDRRWR